MQPAQKLSDLTQSYSRASTRSNFAPAAAPFIKLRPVSCLVFPKNLNLGVTFNLCAAILAFLAALKALGAFLPTVKPAPTALAPLAALAVDANFAILPNFQVSSCNTS